MARNREEDEMIGSIPEHGEDPRFADGEGVVLSSNGAFTEIEDFDQFDTVDVDETPFMGRVTDEDGYPGFRPYVDANVAFDKAAGIDLKSRDPEMPDDEFAADDELAHRINQHEDAATDAVGAPVSDIAQLAQVSRARHAEITSRAKYVRINPESAYRALLGGQQLMTTAKPTTVQVATWSADSDVETTAVTIQFLPVVTSIQNIAGAFTHRPLRTYGVINFGTRGVYTVEVDIGLGQQLTLGASEVSLQVGIEDTRAWPGGTSDQTIVLAGMISFLPCVRTAPLTRTKYIDFLATGSFAQVLVPPFAKTLQVYRDLGNTAAFLLIVIDTAFTAGYTVTIPAGAVAAPVLLAGDITRVVILQTAGPVSNYTLIFELGL